MDSDDKTPERRAELLEADDAICQQHDEAAKEFIFIPQNIFILYTPLPHTHTHHPF